MRVLTREIWKPWRVLECVKGDCRHLLDPGWPGGLPGKVTSKTNPQDEHEEGGKKSSR